MTRGDKLIRADFRHGTCILLLDFEKKQKYLKSQHVLADVCNFISKTAMSIPKKSLSFKQL